MLKNMRENLKHYKWVLLAVIISFVVSIFFWDTGVSGWGSGIGGSWAAKVNGETISDQAYQDAFRNQVQFLSQTFGQNWNPEFVRQVGVADQVLDELVRREVALQAAREMGFRATPPEILREVKKNPVFLDENGNFIGVRNYRKVLLRNGIDTEAFERSIADQIVFNKLQEVLRASVIVGPEEVEEALRRDRERTTIEYSLFRPSAMEVTEEPTDEQLQAWYEEHRDDYLQGERRRVRYVHITKEAALDAVADEDEMRAYYEENPDQYTVPGEARRGRQILLRVPSDADDQVGEAARRLALELTESLQSGEEDFAALAREHSNDVTTAREGGDLGYFAPGELMESVEEAFFAMEPGEIRGPVESPMGYHVLELTEAERGESWVRPYEQVRMAVGERLYFAQMRDWMADKAQAVEEALAVTGNLEQAASREGFDTEETTVDTGEGIRELGAYAEVAQTIAQAEAGDVEGPISTIEGEQIFLNVGQVTAPEPRPFTEVRSQVAEDWRQARAEEMAKVAAEATAQALRDGKTLEEASTEHGVEVQEAGPFTRSGAVGNLGRQPVLARRAFTTEVGEVGPVVELDDGWVVFRVADREELTQEDLESEREPYRAYLENIRFQQIMSQALDELAEDARIRVNERLISAVVAQYLQRSGATDGEEQGTAPTRQPPPAS